MNSGIFILGGITFIVAFAFFKISAFIYFLVETFSGVRCRPNYSNSWRYWNRYTFHDYVKNGSWINAN